MPKLPLAGRRSSPSFSVAAGVTVLVPSLILLFSLFLHGSLDAGAAVAAPIIAVRSSTGDTRSARLAGAVPLACLSAGVALTSFAESDWAHAVGIVCLFACAASAFVFFATIADE